MEILASYIRGEGYTLYKKRCPTLAKSYVFFYFITFLNSYRIVEDNQVSLSLCRSLGVVYAHCSN